MVAPIPTFVSQVMLFSISSKLLPAITNFQVIQFLNNLLTGSTPQRSLFHNSILLESITLQPKGVVRMKKTSMIIEITYLLPEFKTKTICILAANGTSQISMNASSRENTICEEIMD
jgi:hypothetical protein